MTTCLVVDRDISSRFDMSPRKWEIVQSIAAAFAKRGYHGVGMRELAAELNLNQGTLYHHFPSKDEALLTICQVGQAKVLHYSQDILAQKASFPERIDALFAAHLSSLRLFGDFIDVYASQWKLLPANLAASLRPTWQIQKRQFYSMFEAAIARNEIAADTPILDATRVLLALFRTVNILHREGHAQELDAFAAFATRTFLKGLSP